MTRRSSSSGSPCSSSAHDTGSASPLDVGEVRPEYDVVRPEEVHQLARIFLVEGMHPEVPLKRGRGLLFIAVRRLLVGMVQLLEKVWHPAATVLDKGEPQQGEPLEGPVADEGSRSIPDGPVVTLDGQREEARLSEGQRLALDAFPVVAVTVVAAVRGMENDQDAGLFDSLPEGVELRQGEGTRAPDNPRPEPVASGSPGPRVPRRNPTPVQLGRPAPWQ